MTTYEQTFVMNQYKITPHVMRNKIPCSGFLSRGINNRVRWYVAVLKSAVYNAPLLIVTWETVKTACHCRRMSLWDYFKRKGPLPDPQGSLAWIIPSSAIAEFSFTWQIQLSHKMLVLHWRHGPQLWPRKLDCLIVLICLCRGGFEN